MEHDLMEKMMWSTWSNFDAELVERAMLRTSLRKKLAEWRRASLRRSEGRIRRQAT